VRTKPAQVELLEDESFLKITIPEGTNRIMGYLGHKVKHLMRTHFMGIALDGLQGPGDWQRLTEEELLWVEHAINQGAGNQIVTEQTTN